MKKHWVLWVALAFVLLLFGRAVGFDFVNLDDGLHIYSNPIFKDFKPIVFKALWTSPLFGFFIPLTYSVWGLGVWFQKVFWGLELEQVKPFLFHLINLILHLANTTLVYFLLRMFAKRKIALIVGTLLFAIHPLQVEAVVWASALKDLLSNFFALIALVILFRRRDYSQISMGTFLSATVFFFAAMLSKPSTVVLPVIASILAVAYLGRSLRSQLPVLFVWLVGSIPFLLFTTNEQIGFKLDYLPPVTVRPFIVMDSIQFYLGKLLLPLSLTIDYGRKPDAILLKPWLYAIWILPILGFYLFRRERSILLGLTLFVVGLLPTLGFIPFQFQNFSTVADRFAYLAMFCAAIGVATYLDSLPEKMLARRLSVALTFVVCWVIATASQVAVWKNSRALYEHGLTHSKDSSIAHNNLGILFEKEKNYPDALTHYIRAAQVRPRYGELRYNIGLILLKLGEFEKAIPEFQKALQLAPHLSEAEISLGHALYRSGKKIEGFFHFMRGVEMSPKSARHREAYAGILSEEKRYKEAEVEYLRSLELDPNVAKAHNNYGSLLLALGRRSLAIEHFRTAIRLDPTYSLAQRNLESLGLT